MTYNSHGPFNGNLSPADFLIKNELGDFFGATEAVFNDVWQKLIDRSGNSALYISMEIGADLDVYHPLRQRLAHRGIFSSGDPELQKHLKKIYQGPEKIPNYSGGLGVLAGDTLKSYADLRLPVVAISLLYQHGYFAQYVDSELGQLSRKVDWSPAETATLYRIKDPQNPAVPLVIEVPFYTEDDRSALALAHLWMKTEFSSTLDYFVPQLLLDFYIDGNAEVIRDTARQLYNASSSLTKALQRRLLGAGILPVVNALGITSRTIHLNEQHGVVVAIQLISEELQKILQHTNLEDASKEQILEAARRVAQKIVYTIHTPVTAGHDRFDKTLYAGISRKSCRRILDVLAADADDPTAYNFTNFAMRVNRTANSVSKLHRDVTRRQFPAFAHKISAITNGVHHLTWISERRAALFDSVAVLDNWRKDPGVFGGIEKLLTDSSFRSSFAKSWRNDSAQLFEYVNAMLTEHRFAMSRTWINPPNYLSSVLSKQSLLSPEVFTIGFARRFSTYKRADLIFSNIDRLCDILRRLQHPVTFLFAGKAHPADEPGKNVIKHLLSCQEELYRKSNGLANLIFIPNYDMSIAKMLVSGVHVWLNSPKRPLEASGTSGMKAAMNGIPNISIMDGWWVEGYNEGRTGWKFGNEEDIFSANLSESKESLLYEEDSASFYALLPKVLDAFYNSYDSLFLDKSLQNLLLNIPLFNTHRMTGEYAARYGLALDGDHQEKMNYFAKLYSSDNFSIRIE